MLEKSTTVRPGINSILGKDIIKRRISLFLTEGELKSEFSHTVLHGHSVLNAASATPSAQAIQKSVVPVPTNNPIFSELQREKEKLKALEAARKKAEDVASRKREEEAKLRAFAAENQRKRLEEIARRRQHEELKQKQLLDNEKRKLEEIAKKKREDETKQRILAAQNEKKKVDDLKRRAQEARKAEETRVQSKKVHVTPASVFNIPNQVEIAKPLGKSPSKIIKRAANPVTVLPRKAAVVERKAGDQIPIRPSFKNEI
jgi:hypothetical protein